MKKPPQPSTRLLQLYKLGDIKMISPWTDWKSEDDWTNYLQIAGSLGDSVNVKVEEFNKYFRLEAGNGTVAEMHPTHAKICSDWEDWLADNEEERAEYLRLKEKYGDIEDGTVNS